MKNQFDLLVFDWDGTLINTIDWIVYCLQKAGTDSGFATPEPQAAKDVIGLCIESAINCLYPEADREQQAAMVSLYTKIYFSKQLSRNDFFPGIYAMLTQLKQQGFQLAVATGKTRQGLREALTATDTIELFDITRCADETASKPDPKMLFEIMAHTRTPVERTLMIGDSIHDLQMARNANIVSVGVTCGANNAESLLQYDPLMCLQQPTELLNYLI